MSVRTTLGQFAVGGTAGPGKTENRYERLNNHLPHGGKGRHWGDDNVRMAESTYLFQHNYFVFTLILYITHYINTMDQGVWHFSKSLFDKGTYVSKSIILITNIIAKIHNTGTITLLQTIMNLISINSLDYFNIVIGKPFFILNDSCTHK